MLGRYRPRPRATITGAQWLSLALTFGFGLACHTDSSNDQPTPDRRESSSQASAAGQPPPRARNAGWRPADMITAEFETHAGKQIVAQQKLAREQGRDLVVYIGANWCAPCKRFRKLVAGQQYAEHLANLRFLRFDRDLHRDELDEFGYGKPTMIPYFAVPGPDGRGVGLGTGQAIKTPTHIRQLGRRLDEMLAKATAKGSAALDPATAPPDR